MWCLDKITMIDKKGIGWVLKGKPINLKEISEQLSCSPNTISRNLSKLAIEGYIIKKRTPYGIILGVYKAKKRFNKNSESLKERITNNDESRSNNGDSRSINGDSNKIVSIDNTKDIINSNEVAVNPLIEKFKPVNPSYKNLFANKTQRAALERMAKEHGAEAVEKMINALSRINEMPYMPISTTPLELERNIGKIKAKLAQQKNLKPLVL